MQNGIALVGMAGRFPGARSIEEYWRNLVAGTESITVFTNEELAAAGISQSDLQNPDYVRARGLVPDPDLFDAAFFGISQREAELMDPQHRLFLETCWLALEHAAIAPRSFPGLIGVWGGMSTGMTNSTYLLSNLHSHAGLLQPEDVLPALLGNENDYLTSRVSYKLHLRGPSMNVQTACSTSLVAVVQACQSLLTWQCDAALAGGVSVSFPQQEGYVYVEGGIGSPDGHCRAFDANAQGTVFSNGVGIVVLRRLEDAIADGQTIYAVIRGSALNNDGSAKVSFAAPSVDGQAEVVAMAQSAADVAPQTIDYVEAHGTGTPLGDPIEVAALTKAFRAGGATENGFCGLGSVKSNFGHLDSAAGVAGLIKTALALHHQQIPATLHYVEPNPKCDFANSPFFVNAALRPWPRRGHPRRAAVSSFGIGGTNAHVVLEEAPPAAERPGAEPASDLLVISAKTPAALDAAAANLASHLEAHPGVSIADVAHTLRAGRQEFPHRRALACTSRTDAIAVLRGADAKRVATGDAESGSRAVAFMFSGGGTQYANMGRELLPVAQVFREETERCLTHLSLSADVRRALFPDHADVERAAHWLEAPSVGLPALFVVQYALARQWMAWGVQPDGLIGHSMGEYTAACLAGVMSLENALALVCLRGRLFETLPAGEMLGVPLPEAEVRPALGDGLAIAAVNAPSSCVVSGAPDALAAFARVMAEAGVECRRLHIAVAAHSPMVNPILAEFERFLRGIALDAPRVPVVSNLSGSWLTADEARSPQYWTRHLRQTVRFFDGLGTLLAEPNRVLLEVGPGQTLSGFARQHPQKTAAHVVQATLRHAKEPAPDVLFLQQAVGRLWTAGVPVNWAAYNRGEGRRRVPLPAYPFEKKRYLVESPQAPVPAPLQALAPRADATQQMTTTVPSSPARSRADRIRERLTEILHKLSGLPAGEIDPALSFLEMGFDSLFLTQASLRFKAEFKVRITFRQLFEEAPTIDALTSYIDAKLPADAFPAPAEAAPAPFVAASVLSAGPHAALAGVPAAAPGTLQHVIQQQLQLMAEQLRMLGGNPALLPAMPPPASSVAAADAGLKSRATTAPVSKPHAAFKPIDGKASAELSPEQMAALAAWIDRYTRRTAGSKRRLAEYRPVLADPRSVAGFNRLWKEMIYPIITDRSEGSKVWDVDGNEYVDLVGGFGSLLFGHRSPIVVDAVEEQLHRGFELGPLPPLAGEVAALVKEFTGMERVGFSNTGSEAVLAATRFARTVTGRDKIAVFEGSYHGLLDEVLSRPLVVNGELRSAPAAPGIAGSAVSEVILLEYANPKSLEVIRAHESEIAAILVEPVQSRRLDLQPKEFLHEVRRVADEIGAALIFDEVITGFRVHPGGAQAHFGVRADLAAYGKVVGGGMPIGIVAGNAKFMDAFDGGHWEYGDGSFPEVGVTYFAGTFMRHPLALAAAKAVLTYMKSQGPGLQTRLADRIERLANDARAIVARHGAPYQITQFSSMMSLNFPHDQKTAVLLFFLMRERGIHIWEGRPFFFTTAHTEADYAAILRALDESLAEMQAAGFFGAPAHSALQVTGTADQDVLPFTEGQQEIWLGGQMGEAASRAYNEVVALDLRGPLNRAAMQRAVDEVVARHESLRMTVASEPLGLRHVPGTSVPVEWQDVSGLPEDAQHEAVQKVLEGGDGVAFDVERGPLLRVTTMTLTPEHHVFVMAAHHLVCDGWSFGVILRDLATFYSAQVRGTRANLEAPMQVSRFAREDREAKQSPEAAETEAFWIRQFDTVPEPLELPADRPRPPVKSYQGARVSVPFDAALARGAKKLAAEHRTTLFTTLLGVFETLVYRLTGQQDFVVGIPVAVQPLLGEDLVAHCVNFVPLRARVSPTATFSEYLNTLRTQSLDLNEHQNFTYGSLLAKLRLPKHPGRDPLVSTSFTLEPAIVDPGFDGLTARSLTVPRVTSKRDLHVNVMEMDGGLLVEADYSTDLFDEPTVRRWLDSYRILLEAVVSSPGRSLLSVPVISEPDRSQLVTGWNDTAADYPRDRVIHQLVEERAVQSPEGLALVCGAERLTWTELNRRANRLAHALVKKGVAPGSRVALCLERSAGFIVSVLAVHKAGAAYVPLDPVSPGDRKSFVVEDSGAVLVVTDSRSEGRWLTPRTPVLHLDADSPRIAQESQDDLKVALSAEDAAYVIYTSGSTGQPKGVVIGHRQLVNYTWAVIERIGLPAGSSYALVSNVAADSGVTGLSALAMGWVLHVITSEVATDGRALGSYLTVHDIDFLKITPSLLASLLGDHPSASLLPRRCLMLGGEPSRPAWVEELQRLAPGCRIMNHYGPTETTVGVLTYWTGDPRDLFVESVPAGRPLGNVRAYVLDPAGAPAPIGVVGELCIGGACVARGYLNRPDLTAERFVSDPFATEPGARMYRTGDRARFRADGNIEFLGRADYQVKVRGFRVELGEIEAALRAHEGVEQAVVVLRKDQPGDERLIGYVTTGGGASISMAELRTSLKQRLPDYMVPAVIVALDKLPVTSIGKIDRRALPAPPERASFESEFVAPATETERRLAEIWSAVLGLEKIGAHDNFFDLGGHSLLAARTAMKVRDTFRVDVSLITFFEMPTIAMMAAAIDAGTAAPASRTITPRARVRARRDQLVRP